ncbi:hypothetical protein [Streptomyces sp. NPDC057257]|uniref:hypothetical protein n=1 Tax=Streptomyces sp. NPDC057257 TaxID=3346071 RepID=UPI003643C3E4
MDEKPSSAAAHKINGVELSEDPADLFVILYDLLPEEHFCADEAIDWFQDPTVNGFANQVCKDVLAVGRVTGTLAGDIAGEVKTHGSRGMFAALLGLDRALAVANPFSPYYNESAMAWLSVRYISHNRLNNPDRTTGLLLPRCARPGKIVLEWEHKADFFNVHRATARDLDRIRIDRIPSRNDPGFTAKEPISVGAVPMLEKYADLEFDWKPKGAGRRYRITPSEPRLSDRVGQAARNLWESDARIGVLPESTLSDPLLRHWTDVLRELPDDSGLEWLLLGTGPVGDTDPPPNRAVLVDCRTGQTILEQDKMAGFTLTADLATQWRLPGEPHRQLAREGVLRGLDVAVLDSSLGRLAILICEDVKQTVPFAAKLQALGVSHILVPLFAAPILRARVQWERQAAQRCVEEFGAWVVLSNSLAVGAEMDVPPYVEPEDGFSCVVVGPPAHKASTYAEVSDTQFCRADSAVDLSHVLFRNDKPVTPEDSTSPPLPTVRPGWSEVEPSLDGVTEEPDWGGAG